MPAFRWTQAVGWTLLGILLLLSIAALYYVGDAALDKDVSPGAKLFLVSLALAAIAVAFFAERSVLKVRRWGALARPKPVVALYSIFLVFLTTLAGILPLIEPRSVNASDLEASEDRIKKHIDRPRPALRPAARIAQRLPGLWGEPGCQSIYSFRIDGDALIVDWQRRPNGAAPYRLVARITKSDGDVIEAYGLEPAEARGRAATFLYAAAGPSETLTWDDQSLSVPLELDRCGGR